MKNLLDYLVKNIVSHPDKVVIKLQEKDDYLNFSLKTGPEDMGKIIGRGGKTIKALRTLLRLKAMILKKGATLQLIEDKKTAILDQPKANQL